MNSWKKTYSVDKMSNLFEVDFDILSTKNPDSHVILKNLWVESNPTIQKISIILVPKYQVSHTFKMLSHISYGQKLNLFDNVDGDQPAPPEIFDWGTLDNLEKSDFKNLYRNPDNPDEIEIELDEIKEFEANYSNPNISKLDLNLDIDLESLLKIKNTLLVSSLSIETIKLINSYNQNQNQMKNKYIKIPVSDIVFVSKLISRSKYRLFLHFEKSAQTSLKITAKYSMLQNFAEIERFDAYAHEYLIKRGIETTIKLDTNLLEHQITPKFTNWNICTIVISSPVELESIKVKDQDNIEYEFMCSKTNPENPYSSETTWFYLLDQFAERYGFDLETYQPIGSYILSDSNPIEIKLNKNNIIPNSSINLNIMYLTYDIVRYRRDSFIGLSTYINMYQSKIAEIGNEKLNDLIKLDKLLTFEEFASHYYSWIKLIDLTPSHFEYTNNNLDIDINIISYNNYERRYLEAHPNPEPMLGQEQELEQEIEQELGQEFEQVQELELNWNAHFRETNNPQIARFLILYEQIFFPAIRIYIEFLEKLVAKCKKLDQDTICEITFDSIKYNDYYYHCNFCKGIFCSSAYKTWIEDTTKSGRCPKCQTKISTIPQLYKNSYDSKYLTVLYGGIFCGAMAYFLF